MTGRKKGSGILLRCADLCRLAAEISGHYRAAEVAGIAEEARAYAWDQVGRAEKLLLKALDELRAAMEPEEEARHV